MSMLVFLQSLCIGDAGDCSSLTDQLHGVGIVDPAGFAFLGSSGQVSESVACRVLGPCHTPLRLQLLRAAVARSHRGRDGHIAMLELVASRAMTPTSAAVSTLATNSRLGVLGEGPLAADKQPSFGLQATGLATPQLTPGGKVLACKPLPLGSQTIRFAPPGVPAGGRRHMSLKSKHAVEMQGLLRYEKEVFWRYGRDTQRFKHLHGQSGSSPE